MIGATLRVHLRSPLHVVPFVLQTLRVIRELADAPGFVEGRTLIDGGRTFWVASLWRDRASMDAFYRSDAHSRAVPLVGRWCDEAALAEWESDRAQVLGWSDLHALLVEKGRLTRLPAPSERQLRRAFPPPGRATAFNSRTLRPGP